MSRTIRFNCSTASQLRTLNDFYSRHGRPVTPSVHKGFPLWKRNVRSEPSQNCRLWNGNWGSLPLASARCPKLLKWKRRKAWKSCIGLKWVMSIWICVSVNGFCHFCAEGTKWERSSDFHSRTPGNSFGAVYPADFPSLSCSKTLNKTDQLRSFPLAAGVVHQRVQIVILEATEKVWCLVSYIYRFTEVLAGY